MDEKDLLAAEVGHAYPLAVSNEELWRMVGVELGRLRERAGYQSTLALTKAIRDAPAKGTLDEIERGRPGTIDRLEGYCTVLGWTLSDVLRTVLEYDADEHAEVLSADARWVGLMYQAGPDENLRAGMRGLAVAQDRLRREALVAQPAPSHAQPVRVSGSRGRGRRPRGHQ
jgi:hypothetical protein